MSDGYDPDFVIHPPKPAQLHRGVLEMTDEERRREAESIARAHEETGQQHAPVPPKTRKKRGVDDPETQKFEAEMLGVSKEIAALNIPIHRFTADNGFYVTDWEEPIGITVEIDKVRAEKGGDFQASVYIARTSLGRERRLIGPTRGTIAGPNGRAALAKQLVAADPRLQPVALTVIEISCVYAIEAANAGEPAIRLKDAPKPEAADFLIDPVLYDRNPTIIFGDGGSGKSYVAMALGAGLAKGKTYVEGMEVNRKCVVGYLDWEMSSWEHRGRFESITGPDMPEDLIYIQCVAPLPEDVDRLRKYAREYGINYWIVDSVAPACGGEPESAQVAAAYFNALRALGGASLSIAHISKMGSNQDQKPFGSTFWHNLARLTWFAKATQLPEGISVALYNRKNNLGKLIAPLAIDLDFTDPVIGLRRGQPVDKEEKQLSEVDVYKLAVEHVEKFGPVRAFEIAQGLDLPLTAVTLALRRGLDTGVLQEVVAPDHTVMWEMR